MKKNSGLSAIYFLLSLGWLFSCLLSSSLWAEEADQEPDPPPSREIRPGYYLGVGSCSNGFCHGAAVPMDTTAVLQNEYPTWMGGPHRGAYRVLRNTLSQEIAAALDPGGKPAHEMPECLACHALTAPAGKSENIFPDDGISCESCHGPSGGWKDTHFEVDWTYQKSLNAGMIDLRDAENRAKVCLQCHLGDENRKVDHRLIAAGHPRLYFELDNYNGKMPRHWKVGRSHSMTGVRAWATGQVTAFRASLENLQGYAESGAWPEFSEYNCQSCHHSLADNAWRKQAGYRFQGGLPPYAKRYAVVRQLVAEFADGELENFDKAVEELGKTIATLRQDGLVERAEAVIQVLDGVESKIRGSKWKGDQVQRMMRRIAKERETFLSDLTSAEQAAFALQSLVSRWAQLDRKVVNSDLKKTIDEVFISLDDPDAYDRGRLEGLLARLEEQL